MSLNFNAHRSGTAETGLVHSRDLISCSDAEWLRSLTSSNPRPNLLVLCQDIDTESVARRLRQMCTPPLHGGLLPGALELPSHEVGTLLLSDVASLTLEQQIELFDWMSDRVGTTQVISVTSAPLLSLVEDGRFLEGLLYRLNVVYVIATGSASRARACKVVM
jgi:hypothetical protein